jgi:hypothetical protein
MLQIFAGTKSKVVAALCHLADQLGGAVGAVRDVLAIAEVRRLELGWACSVIGEMAGAIGLAVYAFRQGGAALVGVYGIARTLPASVVAPVIMSLSDRVPRELLLRLATGVRALLLGAAAAGATAGGPAAAVIALAATSSMLASTYRPLLIAILPWVVRSPTELGAVNVLATTMENTGALAGPVAVAALLAAGPPSLAVGVASGFLAMSAFLLWRVRLYQHPDPGARTSLLANNPLRGLAEMARVAPPGGMAVLLFAQTFVRGALSVLLVVLALDVFRAGEAAVGWMYAAMGAGGLAGAMIAAAVVRASRLGRAFVTGLVLWGLPLVLLAPAPGLASCLVALAVVGAGNAIQDIGGGTLTPRLFQSGALERVLGAEELIVFVGGGIGAAAAAPLVALTGARGTLAVLGVALVVLTGAYAFRFVRIDRALPRSGQRTDLIRGVPVFAMLPLAVVDLLATRLSPREYPARTVVMREGEPGDDYQLIVAGSVAVTVRGIERRILSAGDGFGEIALLRSESRTATVTTIEPVQALALQRDDFLAAVTGHPANATAAADLVTRTLKADPAPPKPAASGAAPENADVPPSSAPPKQANSDAE